MATVAEIQTQLGNDMRTARIVKTIEGATAGTDQHYVVGGVTCAGRARWCLTTRADNAATQAAAILTALRA